MLDLNYRLFYKTRFHIEPQPGCDDALWRVVLQIHAWMTSKCEHNKIDLDAAFPTWSDFKLGRGFTCSTSRGSISFESCLHLDDGDELWACRIRETYPSKDGCAPRSWVTEIGFRGNDGGADLSLVLSYGDREGYIGRCEPDPTPTVPRVVGQILRDKKLKCTVAGYPVTAKPQLLEPGELGRFWEMASDPSRELPFVLLSPRTEKSTTAPLVDPRRVAYLLGPNAAVFYSVSPDFSEEMEEVVSDRLLRCSSGTVRVYVGHPRFDVEGDCYRHRYFRSEELLSDGGDEACAILRRALAQDVRIYDSLLRLEDCRRLNWQSSLKRRADAKIGKTEKEAKESFKLASEEEQRADNEKQRADALESELRDCKGKNQDLQMQIDNLRATLGSRGLDGDDLADWLKELRASPSSPRSIAELFVRLYPENLDFTERGWTSLEECQTESDILWEALRDMCTVLHDLYASDGSVDVVHEFSSRSSFSISLGAGSQTRKDGDLMRQYRDRYDGREINVEPHLKSKIGKEKSSKFLRVYYAYDSESGKIVISSCGKHLKNYSTRKACK